MFDKTMRRLIDPGLDRTAAVLARAGFSANQVTIIGFGAGLLAVPMIMNEAYFPGLVAVLANRVLDGLDGALARRAGPTDFGGYLDIVLDMIFYAAIVASFALASPRNVPFALLLLVSFMGTCASFLAYSAIEGRGKASVTGGKALVFTTGLIEGTETIVAFALMCLLPDYFPEIATVFALLCFVTIGARLVQARSNFG